MLLVKKNQSGFTLIETMIAVVILAVVTLGIGSLYLSSLRGVNAVESSQRLLGDMTMVRTALRYKTNCNGNFQNLPFALNQATPVVIDQVRTFDNAGAPTSTLLKLGDLGDGIKINSMRLQRVSTLGTNRVLADLMVQAEKVGQDALAPAYQIRSVPLFLTIVGGRISECAAGVDEETLTKHQICELNSAGRDYYHKDQQKCVSRYLSTCYAGTSTTASCPTTTPVSTLANCEVQEPAGFNDPNNKTIVRNYIGIGGATMTQTIKAPPPGVSQQTGPNACGCMYATDVPNPTAFSCSACCEQLIVPIGSEPF